MGEAALVAPETQNYSRAGLRPGPGSGVVGLGNAGDVSHGKIRLRLINRTQQPNGCNIRKPKMISPPTVDCNPKFQ